MLGKLVNLTKKLNEIQAHDILLHKSEELEKKKPKASAPVPGTATATDFTSGTPVVNRASNKPAPMVAPKTGVTAQPAATAPIAQPQPAPAVTAPTKHFLHDYMTPEDTNTHVKKLTDLVSQGKFDEAHAHLKHLSEHVSNHKQRTGLSAKIKETLAAEGPEAAANLLTPHISATSTPPTPAAPVASIETDKAPTEAPGVTDPHPQPAPAKLANPKLAPLHAAIQQAPATETPAPTSGFAAALAAQKAKTQEPSPATPVSSTTVAPTKGKKIKIPKVQKVPTETRTAEQIMQANDEDQVETPPPATPEDTARAITDLQTMQQDKKTPPKVLAKQRLLVQQLQHRAQQQATQEPAA